MIESWFFVLAMIAVLLIPGPTNALLASSTHQQGVLKTLSYIPVEWLGYIYGIGLWALFIHLFDPIWPALIIILHVCSVETIELVNVSMKLIARLSRVKAELSEVFKQLWLHNRNSPISSRFLLAFYRKPQFFKTF